jgi:hypothetical protein
MFRSYDHLQAEIYTWLYAVRLSCVYNLKVGCLQTSVALDGNPEPDSFS